MWCACSECSAFASSAAGDTTPVTESCAAHCERPASSQYRMCRREAKKEAHCALSVAGGTCLRNRRTSGDELVRRQGQGVGCVKVRTARLLIQRHSRCSAFLGCLTSRLPALGRRHAGDIARGGAHRWRRRRGSLCLRLWFVEALLCVSRVESARDANQRRTTPRLGLKHILGESGIHLVHDVLFFVAHLFNLRARGRQVTAASICVRRGYLRLPAARGRRGEPRRCRLPAADAAPRRAPQQASPRR